MTAIFKALSLLDHFSDLRPRIGLSEFQRITGRDKATLYRHLCELERFGLLDQDPHSRAYSLGHKVERLAHVRQSTRSEPDVLAPLIEQMSRDVGELVHVARLDGTGLRTLCHADYGRHAIRVGFDAGFVVPLCTSSSGRAILAFSDPAKRDDLIEAHALRPVQIAALRADLDTVAAIGLSQTCDTVEVGVSSIGVPLFDASGTVIAACSIAYPTARRAPVLVNRAEAALLAAAPRLTRILGGQVPDPVATLWRDRQSNIRKIA